MGDFLNFFPQSIPTLEHTEPLNCPQKPNFKRTEPQTERGSIHHYFDTHLFFHISIPADQE